MTLTIQSAKENLAKAKEDVQFWENAVRLLSDPRIGMGGVPRAPQTSKKPITRPYGELKRRVLAALNEWKPGGDCYNTTGIVHRMQKAGYVFASKTPTISVNEALMKLQKEGLASVGATKNGIRYWTKAAPKSGAPTGEAAG